MWEFLWELSPHALYNIQSVDFAPNDNKLIMAHKLSFLQTI